MARHKDANWNLSGVGPDERSVKTWEEAGIAVLMDIRDELKRLNATLHCQNFLAIPWTLKGIERNTTRKKRRLPVARRRAA